jgi:hypothetical protein
VIYFRLPLDSTADEKIGWLTRLLDNYADRLDQFITVRSSGVRVRRTKA